jgi:hypothetical protein
MTRRKNLLVLLFLLLTPPAGIGGCVFEKDRGQEIANLVYIPSDAPVEQGRTETVIGTFNIIELHPETASVNTVVFDAQGKKISETPIILNDASLQTSDTLAFGIGISASTKGRYTFQVYTVDRKGRQSNRLTGTFTVTDLL